MTNRVSRQARGCSPKHSNQANQSSVLTSHANPSRRQSLRLKGISAIYKADDASYEKHQQHIIEDNNQCCDNQIFENPVVKQDYERDNNHTKTCDKETVMGSDDLIIINDMTLKDIQRRCKVKKQENLKCVASLTSGLKSDHAFLKPKEEELDLDEPLISLKLKPSSKSSTKRKQKKCSHPSVSLLPVEEMTAQSASKLEAHRSSPIKTDRVSINKEPTADNISVSIDENRGMISLKDPFHAVSPELICAVQSDILNLCDVENMDNGAVSSTLGCNSSCNTIDKSPAEPLQGVAEENPINDNSCCFLRHARNPGVLDDIGTTICSYSHCSLPAVISTNLQVGKPESAQSGISEVEAEVLENTIQVSDSSTADSIAKFGYSENLPRAVLGKDDGGQLKYGESPGLISEHLPYSVDVVSFEMKDDDDYICHSESSEDHFGEAREESSQNSLTNFPTSLSCSKTPPLHADGVLTNADLSSDACDAIESQTTPQEGKSADNRKSYSATMDGQEGMSVNYSGESKTSNNLSHQVDEVSIKTQTCSLQNSGVTEHSLFCREKDDSKMLSFSKLAVSRMGGCLDNPVLEAFARDTSIKGNEDNRDGIVCQAKERSSVDTYDVCPPLHSATCFSTFYDVHGAVESPSVHEVYSSTLEEMVNGYRTKAISPYVDSNCSNVEELTEAVDHSPQVSLPCPNAINDMQNINDSLCKAAEHLLPPVSEEMPRPTTSIPKCNYDGESADKKIEYDQGAKMECHPKKLLSKRKDLSPTSLKMLLQALNGNDFYCMDQSFDCGEAEGIMSSDEVIKRRKMSPDGSPPFTKGILRSPKKCSGTCYCTKSSLISTQAQKAITFSERQMQDVQNIATKLLREMKYMRSIVEDTLSDDCPLVTPKYTCEEMRTATQNVSDIEATTRKWLSMMARDCNRFCKIMRSTEIKADTSATCLRKRRRKISFADEAGASLCHVRIFEQSTSFDEPTSED